MSKRPRIIPVLDVLNGVVVHAIGGHRAQYRPVKSQLTNSAEPRVVAEALLKRTNSQELYIADLNAIQRQGDNFAVLETLRDWPVKKWLDAGGQERPGFQTIIGLETYRVGEALPRGAAVSIDLRGGQFLGAWQEIPGVNNARDILNTVRHFVQMGARMFILLDLQTVGRGVGPSLASECRLLKSAFSDIELLTGGGVRHRADAEALAEAGADGVLLASALHEGTW